MTAKTSTNSHQVKVKIGRLKTKLLKEQEKQGTLLSELKRLEKLERSVSDQNDVLGIAKIKRLIAGI